MKRMANESIMIGDEIEVSVLDLGGGKVLIGIDVPKSVPVFRKEIYLESQRHDAKEDCTPTSPTPARPLEVTHHACQRYAQRQHHALDSSAIDFVAIGDEISHLVRFAIEAGRVSNTTPKAFRQYGRINKPAPLQADARIVWTKDMRLGFILLRETEKDLVITALSGRSGPEV